MLAAAIGGCAERVCVVALITWWWRKRCGLVSVDEVVLVDSTNLVVCGVCLKRNENLNHCVIFPPGGNPSALAIPTTINVFSIICHTTTSPLHTTGPPSQISSVVVSPVCLAADQAAFQQSLTTTCANSSSTGSRQGLE